jgi:hypothetical protein
MQGSNGHQQRADARHQRLERRLADFMERRRGPQPVRETFWLDALREFHQRRRQQRSGNGGGSRGNPGVPGASNWTPIGPSVVRRGQADAIGTPAVSGRVTRIAVANGGSPLYVATALGGVWRSDDFGATWLSNEDSLDVDPTSFASTSLCCGAIAINPGAPNRVYVGTGEGDTAYLFGSRFATALPSYRGIGPVVSDNGGMSWNVEAVAAGSPALAGAAFYALAIDPADNDNVVGATTAGLYQRVPDGTGGHHWVQRQAAAFSSVVAGTSATGTIFYAAQLGGQVFSSPDGSTWTAVGTGFPASGLARITLAMRGTDPSVLYAFAESGSTMSLYRLDGGAGAWHQVTLASAIFSEVSYGVALAVDPNDATVLYFGVLTVWRGAVTGSAGSYSCSVTDIGGTVHDDVHVVVHTPGTSGTLWVGCDGGLFVSSNPTASGASFSPRNTGLATLATERFAQHPSQPAVILCGTQDNATVRYTGEEAWLRTTAGDGGNCIINWNDPYQMIAFEDGDLLRSTDGGASFPTTVTPPGYGFAQWNNGVGLFAAPPMDCAPPSATASDADIIALGTDRPYLSTTFGNAWVSLPNGTSSDAIGDISALTFASATRLYVGTTSGSVYRYDSGTAGWTRTQIDASPLIARFVTHIAVDPADASGGSIYVSLGGSGDYRHVWHYNGSAWTAASGPSAGAATALLDVEHNALAIDPTTTPPTRFVGADVGIWRSTDGGASWSVFSDNLPDAAVLDLQLHQPSRLLRASLHGRGLFEYKLDPPVPLDTELYIRDTDLDTARVATVDRLPDPENPGQVVVHWESPNIKVDVPTPAGYQTPTAAIDFLQFVDTIQDGSGGVATMDPAAGTVYNRVYVEVHNRGITKADSASVMLLLCDASPHLPTLPSGYASNVQAGTAVGGGFTLVGVQHVSNLRAGTPQVVEFALPSTLLPPPASLPGDSHYCLLALASSSQDLFTATQTDVDLLTIGERKVAQKNLHIVAFTGTPPPPAPGAPGHWAAFHLHGGLDESRLSDLVLDTRGFHGRVSLLLPRTVLPDGDLEKSLRHLHLDHGAQAKDTVSDWLEKHRADLHHLAAHGRYDYRKVRHMLEALEHVHLQPLLHASPDSFAEVRGLELPKGSNATAFLAIDPPKGADVGDRFQFRVLQRTRGEKLVVGGCTYSVQILAKHAHKASAKVHAAEPDALAAGREA